MNLIYVCSCLNNNLIYIYIYTLKQQKLKEFKSEIIINFPIFSATFKKLTSLMLKVLRLVEKMEFDFNL